MCDLRHPRESSCLEKDGPRECQAITVRVVSKFAPMATCEAIECDEKPRAIMRDREGVLASAVNAQALVSASISLHVFCAFCKSTQFARENEIHRSCNQLMQ